MRDVFWLFAFSLLGVSLLLLSGTAGVQHTLGDAAQNAVQQAAWSGQSVIQNVGAGGGFSTGNGLGSVVNLAATTALIADLTPITSKMVANPANTVGGQPVAIHGTTIAYENVSIQNGVVEVQISGAVTVPWFSDWMGGILNHQEPSPAGMVQLSAWGNTP